jgi:competence protein ComEA
MPSAWPRAAQRVTAGLLVAALALLSWQAIAAGRWSTRPTTLEPHDAAFRVDLNHADHARLLQLPGVGESMARRIEEHRQKYGDFQKVDDLKNVSGIGTATLERLRPFVYAQATDSPSDEEDDRPPDDALQRVAAARQKPPEAAAPAKQSTSKKAEALSGQLDLNRATAEELQKLPGVGPAMSARIVAARQEKPFRTVDDLRRVRGIGVKVLDRLRPLVFIGRAEQNAVRANEGNPR